MKVYCVRKIKEKQKICKVFYKRGTHNLFFIIFLVFFFFGYSQFQIKMKTKRCVEIKFDLYKKKNKTKWTKWRWGTGPRPYGPLRAWTSLLENSPVWVGLVRALVIKAIIEGVSVWINNIFYGIFTMVWFKPS